MKTSSTQVWLISLLCIFAINLYGLKHVVHQENMGIVSWERWDESQDENHDTRYLLLIIREEKSPLKWFLSDWPLYNGFYRPLPTLLFELDNALFYNDLNKYKISNFVVALICGFLVVWFFWELFRIRELALFCGLLFGIWQSGLTHVVPWDWIFLPLALLCLVYGFVFGRGRLWIYVGAAGVCILLIQEMSLRLTYFDSGLQTISYRVTGWPPGRTATIMVLFSLIALASYCKFERDSKSRWAFLSLFGLVGAFMSYEQSIVVAPCLAGCALFLSLQGVKVRWWMPAAAVTLTVVYLFLHQNFLDWNHPYRLRAMRGVSGGIRDLTSWLFPSAFDLRMIWHLLQSEIGFALIYVMSFWEKVVNVLGNVAAYLSLRKVWMPVLFGLIGSTGAFAPLAFQKPLAHYFYLSLALRTCFVAALIWLLIYFLSGGQRRIFPLPEKRSLDTR